MTTKPFKGKAIYNPSGKAGEYSYWACNLYTGCENDCEYCFCKKGFLKKVWTPYAKLKDCFNNSNEIAYEVFVKELDKNLTELQKHGLLFTFTSDPMLNSTVNLFASCLDYAIRQNVPVKFLTKNAENPIYVFLNDDPRSKFFRTKKELIVIGFTLTGHDELERNASPNQERIETMKKLHDTGFKTFASIEPVVTFPRSLDMIEQSIDYCDLFKIGLQSGKKYDKAQLNKFIGAVISGTESMGCKIYFKDGLLKQAEIDRENLPIHCVKRDYNLFKQKQL